MAKLISMVVSMYLSLPRCTLSVEVTGKRINRGAGYGLEIPAKFHFRGPENAIRWIKTKIDKEENCITIVKKLYNNINHCLK